MSTQALVLQRQRHLKWRALDPLEATVMLLTAAAIIGFTSSVFFDVVTRSVGRPWLWLQEVTSTLFVWGVFLGAAVATRRNEHLYLSAITERFHGPTRLAMETFTRTVVLLVALCMVVFGTQNALHGLGSFRMPSMTPEASLSAAIPVCGVLTALFMIEQIVNGWRHGFETAEDAP